MEANASRYHGKAPDELDWTDAQRQKRAVAEYLAGLDSEIEAQTEEGGDSRGGGSAGKPTPKPDRKPPKVISPSDPSSAWTAKANKRVQFGYGLNYLIDVEHAIIVDVEATPAQTFDEVAATETMIERTKRRFDLKPKRLAADTAYGTGSCCPNMPSRRIVRDINEDARDLARRKMKTKAFLKSRDERKRVEMRFAHLKTHHGFERMRLRGLSGARDEFHLAAIVQNLKTMALRLLGPPTLALGISGLLSSVATASLCRHHRSPAEAGRRWRGRGVRRRVIRSGLAQAFDHAGCIEEGVHLIDQFLEVKRDLDAPRSVAPFSAGLGRIGDEGCPFQPLPHLLQVSFDGHFNRLRVHVRRLLAPHTRSVCGGSRAKGEQSYGSLRAIGIIFGSAEFIVKAGDGMCWARRRWPIRMRQSSLASVGRRPPDIKREAHASPLEDVYQSGGPNRSRSPLSSGRADREGCRKLTGLGS
jgi:hypothetical protein